MAKYRIYDVTLSKKTVGPGERLVVQVFQYILCCY